MLLLTSTTEKIQVVTPAATRVDMYACWADIDGAGAVTFGNNHLQVTSATTTDLVGSPLSGVTRNVRQMEVHAQGGAQQITVNHFDGTLSYELIDPPLGLDEHLTYDEAAGFRVLDIGGAVKMTSATAGGRLIRVVEYSSTGAFTHTTSGACYNLRVRMVGGGGGGGGTGATAAVSASAGSGGGSGAYAEKILACAPNTGYSGSVGTSGGGGSAAGGAAGAGGATSITVAGVTVSANGGGAGTTGGAALTTVALTAGGAAGTVGVSGDVNHPGQGGDPGLRLSGTQAIGGAGGTSLLMGANGTPTMGSAGVAGTRGGGGSGATLINGGTAVAGGAGAIGCVIVEEYT